MESMMVLLLVKVKDIKREIYLVVRKAVWMGKQ